MATNPGKLIRREFFRSSEAKYIHRLHGVLLVIGGMSAVKAAKLLQAPPRTVAHWVKRFGALGLNGLIESKRSGRPAILSSTQRAGLKKALASSPRSAGFPADVWTGDLVSQFLRRRYGRNLTMRHCRRFLRTFEGDAN